MDYANFVLDAPGSVFDGLTAAKVEIINGALYGRRVRLHSKRDGTYGGAERGRHRDTAYVFLGLALPGSWRQDPFRATWDLELQSSPGIRRIVSPALVTHFEILREEERLQCEDCFAFRRRGELHDFGLGPNPDFEEQEHLRSRLCCRSGDC